MIVPLNRVVFFYPPPVNSFVVLNMCCLTFLLWAIAFEILMRQPDLHGSPLPVKPKLSFARSELLNFRGMFISYFLLPTAAGRTTRTTYWFLFSLEFFTLWLMFLLHKLLLAISFPAGKNPDYIFSLLLAFPWNPHLLVSENERGLFLFLYSTFYFVQ